MDEEGVMPETDSLVIQTFACVWDALADSPAEAVAMRLRSDLLSAIQQTVASWSMTGAAVARRLELTGPRLDELLRGSFSKFSFNDLIQLAIRADLNVRVQIEPAVRG